MGEKSDNVMDGAEMFDISIIEENLKEKDSLRLLYQQTSSPSILVFLSVSCLVFKNLLLQTSLCSHQPQSATDNFIAHRWQRLV